MGDAMHGASARRWTARLGQLVRRTGAVWVLARVLVEALPARQWGIPAPYSA